MSQERSDFRETLREAAGRAGAADPRHPDLARLAAYHGGELAEPEAEKVREHLALCRDCADLLLDYQDFAREEAAGTASATAAAWERDRKRVRAAVGRSVGEPEPGAELPPEARPWVAVRRRPVLPWLAAAAATAVSLVLAVLWWQARVELHGPRQVELAYLEPEGSSALRSPEAEVEVSARPGVPPVILLHLAEPSAFPRYQARIVPPAGESSDRILELEAAGGGLFAVELGAEPEPGEYEVILSGIAGGERREVARYRFRIRAP